jgi:NAD(P)-dependent dehydrogenase (short-subunit alcohol dehydrogenase family)
MGLGAATAEFETNMAQSVGLKRFGQADEVAQVALFLASNDASYVVGTEVFVDGGLAEF